LGTMYSRSRLQRLTGNGFRREERTERRGQLKGQRYRLADVRLPQFFFFFFLFACSLRFG
jgi:hypothetical protein